MKVYVPNKNDYTCITIYNKDTIRAYKNEIDLNISNDYDDIYIHSDYYVRSGTEELSQLPNCLSSEEVTSSYYYRIDFLHILCIFCILSILCFGVPLKIFSRLLGRRIK